MRRMTGWMVVLAGLLVVALGAPSSAARPRAVPFSVGFGPVTAPSLTEGASAITKHNLFKPKKIDAVATTTGSCTATTASFVVSNDSRIDQEVTFNGTGLGVMSPHTEAFFCGYASGDYLFGLTSNSQATLQVIIDPWANPPPS